MAWNEPGGGSKDPWGGGRDQGPPDLDEVARKIRDRLGALFGRRHGGGRGGTTGIGLLLIGGLVAWLLSGIYIVDPAERGVVLRFGKYIQTTTPGPHWHIPYPIERVEKVNVERIRSVQHKALMLTQDENIIDLDVGVQYRVKDAREYLFNVRDPDTTLRQATESAVREIIGKSTMDFVLTEGRAEIASRTEKRIQELLDLYRTGLQITTVNLQDAQPPEEVQGAFADAIKAREDEQRLKNEAEAYANEVIPKARGAAARQLEEANAYKARVIAEAEGETSRFLAVLKEYEKAPLVTRQRLYIEAMEYVLANSNKVMVDVEGGSPLFYLPLDKLMQGRTLTPPASVPGSAAADRLKQLQKESRRLRNNRRRREVR